LAEYCHIILMSTFGVILFLGGWWLIWFNSYYIINLLVFAGKICFCIFFFIWVRASFPRIRYDQLMALLWKSYLPVSLAFVIAVASVLLAFNSTAPF
jgi:NADH:ubiquinone oxidoreductase subunit H